MKTRVLALLFVCLAQPVMAASLADRIVERGPATFVIGATFVVMGLASLPVELVSGDGSPLSSCRLAHGTKMLAAGTVLLPTGLALAPFAPARAGTGFADSFAEAFQEDTCSRPATAVFP